MQSFTGHMPTSRSIGQHRFCIHDSWKEKGVTPFYVSFPTPVPNFSNQLWWKNSYRHQWLKYKCSMTNAVWTPKNVNISETAHRNARLLSITIKTVPTNASLSSRQWMQPLRRESRLSKCIRTHGNWTGHEPSAWPLQTQPQNDNCHSSQRDAVTIAFSATRVDELATNLWHLLASDWT